MKWGMELTVSSSSLGVEMSELVGSLWFPKELRASPHFLTCLRQRPLPPGVPQPVPLTLALAPAPHSLLWQSHPVLPLVFKYSPKFLLCWWSSFLFSHAFMDLFLFKSNFFPFHFYKFECRGGRYIFLVFLSQTGLSLVDLYFLFLIISEFSFFFPFRRKLSLFQGESCCRNPVDRGTAHQTTICCLNDFFFPFSIGLCGASYFWTQELPSSNPYGLLEDPPPSRGTSRLVYFKEYEIYGVCAAGSWPSAQDRNC